MAEWLCSGLQSRVPRFDSGFRLHYRRKLMARVVKLVDTADLKSAAYPKGGVPVRFRFRAPPKLAPCCLLTKSKSFPQSPQFPHPPINGSVLPIHRYTVFVICCSLCPSSLLAWSVFVIFIACSAASANADRQSLKRQAMLISRCRPIARSAAAIPSMRVVWRKSVRRFTS